MKIENLSIGYDSRKAVASAINAELDPGDFICLIGRNGSGKSTLLKTLAGMQKAVAGKIMLDGRELNDFSTAELSYRISMVLTHVPELPNTTLRELVSYGRLPYSSWLGRLSDKDIEEADKAIALLHLETLAGRKITQLSDGEKQKAMIARALAQGTDIILLDEPAAFLDYESRIELMEMLGKLAHDHNKAILLSTHDREMAYRYTDIIWQMKDGTMLIEKIHKSN